MGQREGCMLNHFLVVVWESVTRVEGEICHGWSYFDSFLRGQKKSKREEEEAAGLCVI